MCTELQARLAGIPLIDHHVHGPLRGHVTRAEFEALITESDRPVPPWMTQFDSQIGFAVRRHCASLLGLAEQASAEGYWAARGEWSMEDAAREATTVGRGNAARVYGLSDD
ncbi:hypothetical protein SAMN05216215_101490 [Saccharopolyspora shandongensis]|uniref:Amidohydrolase n=1 Tax=Saccharopolyspora shandongensis TaxID=418495 RepID=A0A1H3E531_9PSEU|nr:hypothetical protein [Saccharopolyspora shandongensis]SDX73358.1 hypothetical protein SAMN05216215_101490 [Saccharopolyspora shandongensis]